MLLVLEGGTKLLLLMFQDNACGRQGGVLGSEVVKGKRKWLFVCRRKLNVWSEFVCIFVEGSIMAIFKKRWLAYVQRFFFK